MEKALKSGSVDELQGACLRVEEASALRPTEGKLQEWLTRLYLAAGATPLAELAIGRAREKNPSFSIPEFDGVRFSRSEGFSHEDYEVRVYAREHSEERFLAFLKDSHLAFFMKTEGKGLLVRLGAFGPYRGLGMLDSTELPALKKAVSFFDADRKLLEETDLKVRQGMVAEDAGERLTAAARLLHDELTRSPGRLGLLEELWWVYDRLGELVAGTKRESEYRRLELEACARLAEVAPGLSTTRRAESLTSFRVGAIPLAAAQADQAPRDPLAESLLEVLSTWGQSRHARVESFETSGGAFKIESYEAKDAPPESSALFPEWTFIVRKEGKPDYAVYTFCSQKLRTGRHYCIYVQHLADRVLITTFGDHRPADLAVKEKVLSLLGKLGESAGTKK